MEGRGRGKEGSGGEWKGGERREGKEDPPSVPSAPNLPLHHCCIAVSRSGLHSHRATEMQITVRYGYSSSIGSLVWALTRGQMGLGGAFEWGQVRGTLDRGK